MKFLSPIRRGCAIIPVCVWMVLFTQVAQSDAAPTEKGYVGLSVHRDGLADPPTVAYVAAKSPAEEAGVRVGDGIVAINDAPPLALSGTAVKSLVDGPVGTTVQLTLQRANQPALQVTIMRRSLRDTYTPAAEAGDAKAAYWVGWFYEQGPEASHDLTRAAGWYRRAAEGGDARARTRLGDYCAEGWGVPKDLPAAANWYALAARQGNAEAQRQLAYCYLLGNGLAQSDRDAFYWFQQSARQDDPAAETNLGGLYRKGKGVAQDDRAAFAWYYRAAARNDPYGQWGLAFMYADGRGVKKNPVEALKWYLEAQKGISDDPQLKEAVANARLRAFESDFSALSNFDVSMLPAATRKWLVDLFVILGAVFLAGGIALLIVCFRARDASEKLTVAFGWLSLLFESQAVAFLGLLCVKSTVDAGKVLGATAVCSALPVILSSCGPLRARFWKKPTVSVGKMLLYALGAVVGFICVGILYRACYALATHSALPAQPTQPLFAEAKSTSAWVTYSSVALLLPAAEEIVFRGYLYNSLRRFLSDWKVVGTTALVFAAAHFQWLYFLPLAGFGLILGWARLKTGSLWLPVLLHMVNNGVITALTT